MALLRDLAVSQIPRVISISNLVDPHFTPITPLNPIASRDSGTDP
jgi:hypothetical protein